MTEVERLTIERDAAFEKYAQAVKERNAAEAESAKADDETRILKQRIRTLELLGTQEEIDAVYKLRRECDELKAQVERLLANEAKRIEENLLHHGR